jgi:hypothetical protein
MKKLLGILIIFLFWNNISFANSGVYKECFIKQVTLPKLKIYERKSFNEMKDFPDPKNILEYKNKFFLSGVNFLLKEVKTFKEIKFEPNDSEIYFSKFKVVLEDKNGSILLKEYSYEKSINAEDYIEYKMQYGNRIIVHLKDDTLELKSHVRLFDPLKLDYNKNLGDYKRTDYFSIFLKCNFEPYKISIKKKKKKRNKIISSYEYYLILLGIISLINFGGIVYLIKRKK